MGKQRNIALGFYQNQNAAESALSALRRKGFNRSVSIHCSGHDHISINTNYLYFISGKVLKRFKKSVLHNETLIIAEIKDNEGRQVLNILRSVESDHPITFLLRSDSFKDTENDQNLLKEPLPQDQLQVQAIELAYTLKNVTKNKKAHHQLKALLQQKVPILEKIRSNVADAEHIEQTVTLSGSWLLDNDYVIQENIREIQRGLPLKYYRELPILIDGPMAKLPRIYALSVNLIDATANRLNQENIIAFLDAFQSIEPLTIGELWALPLMLRLRLIECIHSLAVLFDARQREGELARYFGNRLLTAARRQPGEIDLFLKSLKQEEPHPTPHFVEELLEHLFDEDAVLNPVREWVEKLYSTPISEIIQKEQKQETINEVAFSSAVISLISLRQLSWREIFEKTSVIDAILKNDPLDVYQNMNFTTRDNYRHAIETLARSSRYTECEIAHKTVERARSGKNGLERHVGYYLIDAGLAELEKEIDFKPSVFQNVQRFLLKNASIAYLMGILTITLIIECLLGYLSIKGGAGFALSAFFLLLSLVPASEIAIQLIQSVLPLFTRPYVLPKMNFINKIPETHKTLVVIPSMLTSEEVFNTLLNTLEIHYLANADQAIKFALILDYPDAPEKSLARDKELQEIALKGMQALSHKYGENQFFLFLRPRTFSKSEGAWIGWERKRGKLECLNRFLLDSAYPEMFVFGQREALRDTRFVITLDMDTQLPKGKAAQLIETIAHPLNAARLSPDKKIERGYTIIQPRVSTEIGQRNHSWFTRIFSDSVGIDPYTQASADIYMDLMQEGSYYGKCIYDLHAFDQILSGRFPEEHLLSHDLLEGAYARTAYASDIALFDTFPENYHSFSLRQHRWMRGDFQIVDWLSSKVPNSLSLINRWKIFDNLRRALTPPILLALLMSAWFFSAVPSLFTLLAAACLFMPVVSEIFGNPLKYLYAPLTALKDIIRSFTKTLINISLLPYQALLSIDALIRVVYRRSISHRYLLEWPQVDDNSSSLEHRIFILKLMGIPLFALAVLFAVSFNPLSFFWALPFCILWMLSPLIIALIDNPSLIQKDTLQKISLHDQAFLREMARRTWRYFDDFVGTQSNWLPPDNFQASLKIEVAPRTSPTNIGLWLLSAVSAYDLKYLTADALIDRLISTFKTLKKLETHQGHLLNWYDTNSLNALHPRYVSTVDNGNLLGSLWTLEQSLKDLLKEPLFPANLFAGLYDTFQIFSSISGHKHTQLENIFSTLSDDISTQSSLIKSASNYIQELKSLPIKDEEALYWLQSLELELNERIETSKRYLEWAEIIQDKTLLKNLKTPLTLETLASGKVAEEAMPFLNGELSVKEALHKAQWLAGEKIEHIRQILTDAMALTESTQMEFLYNQERKLFSIGFNVEDQKLDNSYYDLLASEARIASLVAIAKGEAPLEHWWSLGRSYRIVDGRKILVSWGGTMFEYLMPLLFTKYYEDSLLGNGCKNAVYFQERYANKRGIPWGISEAAFSEIDGHRIYQYRSFGIPELGFKRGLENDLVVSPYSSALALLIKPLDAIKNLKRLSKTAYNLFASHGFYESIDFTRQKGPHGERGIIIYAFMAHHQGMSLLAINNVLNNDIIQKRFHNDPRIKGVESLLYEQIPIHPPLSKGYKRERPVSRLIPFSFVPMMGVLDTPHTSTPKANLLGNGSYSVMITNTGGGYSKWEEADITRWRADTTCDPWGTFCYIKDLETGKFWSSAYNPTDTKGQRFSVKFKPEKAEFQRRDNEIETTTDIFVSPQDNAEIRLITIGNLSRKSRTIELTSYSEIALAPHKTDRQHPCFNKMFIQTEEVPALGILAFRRLRSETDTPLWAAHLIACSQPSEEPLQFETDRSLFIGRGNSLSHPQALNGNLTNSQGFVLDPIFSLRRRIKLEGGQRVQVAFITAVARDRRTLVSLMKKYNDINASHVAMEMAWTNAQLDLRHLRIHQEEAQLYMKLASHLLYPHSQLRPSQARLTKCRLPKSRLWAHSISGDLPIIAVSIADIHEIDLIKQVLTAHALWCMRGLKVDLVILNEESISYESPLYEQLERVIHSQIHCGLIGEPGGIFLLNSDQISEEDALLIQSVAAVHLVAARGFLRQHLASPIEPAHYPSRLVINKKIPEDPSNPLPFMELPYFNGLGGFTQDGKEYAIYLGPNTNTPAPWINVIANPKFGTIVTESGLGCTWYGNSQTNRLTPWSNDPLLNPIGDILYIRDDKTGTVWTPTPSPIREDDAYRIRHGQGYTRFEHNSHGIEQHLLVFVPIDESGGLPMRVQKLTLINRSNHKRSLSLFSYSELVLGGDKEDTQMHVITAWDLESGGLMAWNNFNCAYENHVAFACSSIPVDSYSGNRTEFIGRNHHSSNPAALKRKALSGQTGAGFDPCAALQVNIELEPGAQKEIIFVLGYAASTESARSLISQVKDPTWFDKAFAASEQYWNTILSTVQIECPDSFINFALNRWLLYQNLSCRLYGRSGFYQSSGAFGFRDQLQDSMALLYTAPQMTRAQILRSAAQQFIEGDVQHWWLPPLNSGVRTRISDDLLWLPFVTAHYLRVTNDLSILQETVPFIKGDLLKEDQQETFFTPEISSESGTLLEHCRRAILKGTTAGPHGLPLIGCGDWNDGMNHVGIQGKGESIWLGWFLIHVLEDFAYILAKSGQPSAGVGYREYAAKLAKLIEENGWDGEWYLRAYMDDGTPLGSKNNEEDKIDSLPQSWAVISGAGDPKRSLEALTSAEKHLVMRNEKLVLLLTPPFDKTHLDPGYIKGYPPGVRENGGQYTHGSTWVPLAFARLGDGDKAVHLLSMMHPVMHTPNMEGVNRYKIEPYVLAGDVYSLEGKVGRGGWSWYTGSSAWMYRIWLEEIFGFQLRGDILQIKPAFPQKWANAKVHYKFGSSMYTISYENPERISGGTPKIELDGKELPENQIHLVDDGKTHQVRVMLYRS